MTGNRGVPGTLLFPGGLWLYAWVAHPDPERSSCSPSAPGDSPPPDWKHKGAVLLNDPQIYTCHLTLMQRVLHYPYRCIQIQTLLAIQNPNHGSLNAMLSWLGRITYFYTQIRFVPISHSLHSQFKNRSISLIQAGCLDSPTAAGLLTGQHPITIDHMNDIFF